MASEMMELKVVSLDRVYGPVPMETLTRLARGGRIAADDLVRRRGTQAWIAVLEVPVLAACLPQASAAGKDLDSELSGSGGRAGFRKRAEPEDVEMDMTPMIDVTFQLLIFFMLSHTWANLAAMEVPEAVHGRGVTVEGQQVILIDEAGSYYIGDRPEPEFRHDSPDSLVKEVQANAAKNGGQAMDVIIHGHKKSRHKAVRDLVERLGAIPGIGKVLLGIQEKYQ